MGRLATGMRPKLAAALVVVAIAALPACSEGSKVTSSPASKVQAAAKGQAASGVQAAPKPRITVKPTTGHPRTRFVVSFTAPLGGRAGGYVRYVVSARTGARRGCMSSAFASVSARRSGARVGAKLVLRGGSWCVGTYRGKIIETFEPPCPPGKLCPAFIGVIRTIGTFTFRVKTGTAAPAQSS
jgi:hypothetical protein